MAERGAATIADFELAASGGSWLPTHFWRYAAWGAAATLAFALAMVALASEPGSQRLAAAWRGHDSETTDATTLLLTGRINNTELEARRLNELVRVLSADRDRLTTRVASLERNLDEMSGASTGSTPGRPTRSAFVPQPAPPPSLATTAGPIATVAAQQAPPVPAPPAISPPQTVAANAGRVADTHAAAQAEPETNKAEFGIDVGSEASLEALRKLWGTLRGNHAALLDTLRPLMVVKEGQKPGAFELRLVLGPLASPAVASRYCTALSVSGVACQPAPYDGQRLAAR